MGFSKTLCLQITTGMPCSTFMGRPKTRLVRAFSTLVRTRSPKDSNFLGLSGRQPL